MYHSIPDIGIVTFPVNRSVTEKNFETKSKLLPAWTIGKNQKNRIEPRILLNTVENCVTGCR